MEQLYTKIKHYPTEPEYYIQIESFATSFEIYVNDSPIFSYFRAGGINTDFEINYAILKKGVQKLKVVMLPAAPTEKKGFYDALGKNNFVEVVVYKTYNNDEDDDVEVLRLTSPNEETRGPEYPVKFPHYLKPEYIMTGTFNTPDIPYELTGWSKSKDLTTEDPDKLLKEVVAKYEEIRKIFVNKDYEALSKELYQREYEIAQSLYYNQEDINDRTEYAKEIFKREKYKVVDSIKNYRLRFFGEGKMVALARVNTFYYINRSPLYIEYTERDNEKISHYPLLLHKPEGSDKLEVIR
ncbi:MAG: hypothetical protein ACK5MZ_08375 [Aestuariibaculum sp.]